MKLKPAADALVPEEKQQLMIFLATPTCAERCPKCRNREILPGTDGRLDAEDEADMHRFPARPVRLFLDTVSYWRLATSRPIFLKHAVRA